MIENRNAGEPKPTGEETKVEATNPDSDGATLAPVEPQIKTQPDGWNFKLRSGPFMISPFQLCGPKGRVIALPNCPNRMQTVHIVHAGNVAGIRFPNGIVAANIAIYMFSAS